MYRKSNRSKQANITSLTVQHISGGDLFERLSPPDYHLTEDKCQLFIRQILQGRKLTSPSPSPKSKVQAKSQIEKGKRNLDSGLSLESYGPPPHPGGQQEGEHG